MKICKYIIVCFCVFLPFYACTILKKETKQGKIYYSTTNWEKMLSSLYSKNCEYMIFDEVDTTDDKTSKLLDGKLKFKLMNELISLQFNKTILTIRINKAKSTKEIKTQFDNVINRFEIQNIYKVKSKKDSLTIIEYRRAIGSGKAINMCFYIAIDKDYNTYLLSAYKGSIVCFNDLDKDGDIDFLEILSYVSLPSKKTDVEDTYLSLSGDEKNEPSVLILLQDAGVDAYSFNFVELQKGKIIRKNNKYSNLAIIECNDHSFIQIHKDSISNLKGNPCLEKNSSIRREIERHPSPIID